MAALPSERRQSVSSIGGRSTESPPRLSRDKRHSPDRRLSTDSSIRTPLPNLPGVSSLPGLSSNSPLIAGSSMAPPIPPKDRLPPPMTPTRKPVQRQKSPLSSEAFSSASPASTMPGAFPASPSPVIMAGQSNATAYAGNSTPYEPESPSQNTPSSGRRSSGFRNFLPFKALRRSYFSSSTEAEGKNREMAGRPSTSMSLRPTTPGADSDISGDSRPDLRHKVSGSFWKRKSSLGIVGFASGSASPGRSDSPTTNPSTNGTASSSPRLNGTSNGFANGNGVSHEEKDVSGLNGHTEEDRSSTPITAADSSDLPKPRKSGTFWRRRSSLNLTDGEKPGWTAGIRKASMDLNGATTGKEPTSHRYNTPTTGFEEGPIAANSMEVPIVLRRSHSPPPQLPPLAGEGSGLGDLFKDF